MKELIIVIIVVLAVEALFFLGEFIVRKITYRVAKKNNLYDMPEGVVGIPLVYRLIMLVSSIVFLGIGVFCYLFPSDPSYETKAFIPVFFPLVSLAIFSIFLFWTMWRICFDENGFEYRNYFGIKKRYEFKDLELWEHPKGTRWKFLKSGKRVVTFSYVNSNCDELIDEYFKSKKVKE